MEYCASLFLNGVNGMLADASGLGKTSVAIAFLEYLRSRIGIPGPFLICCALGEIPQWNAMLRWSAAAGRGGRWGDSSGQRQ